MTISKTEPKSIHELLQNNQSWLGKLITKTDKLQHLNRLWHQIITTELGQHCHVANLHDGLLTLVVDDANWATHLRFAIPDMIKMLKIQPEFNTVKKIRYKIARN